MDERKALTRTVGIPLVVPCLVSLLPYDCSFSSAEAAMEE